ncbi:ZU5 domain-containing protein [Ditylenchus destructor]|nr:ZU5 domain-containing protein [Ditylenchus destructor]
MEQASKLKKHHAHLLTATLDASKEDGWFEALRQLIFHLQERRVWMPEFQPTQPIEDLLLFPMQNCNLAETPDSDSNKADYGIYDATGSGTSSVQATPAHRQNLVDSLPAAGSIGGGVYAGHGGSGSVSTHTPNGSNSPFFAAFARNSPYSHSSRNTYGSDIRSNAGPMLPPQGVNGGGQLAGYYDVKQILAEHYPESTTTNTSMNSVIQSPGPVGSRPSASSPYKSQQPIAIPRQSLQAQHHIAESGSIRSPERARSEANSQLNDISMLTYDAPYIDDTKQRNPSPFRFTDVDDYENNNQLATTTTTLNVNLSPANPGVNYQSDIMSPKRHAAISNIRSSTDPIVIEHVNGVFNWKGGSLRCPESGVELSVPESAIPFGLQQELFVKVCRENQQNPPLDTEKQESLMSPLVMCGPQGVSFQVPVELKLPHNSTKASDPTGTSSPTNFVLKSGSGANWRNIEVVKPPETSDKFVTVLVNHF